MISSFFLKLMSQFLLTGNRTSSRPILSVIILVINKSDSRFVGLHSKQESTRSYYHYKYGLSLTNPFPLTLRLAPTSASTTKMSLLLRYSSLEIETGKLSRESDQGIWKGRREGSGETCYCSPSRIRENNSSSSYFMFQESGEVLAIIHRHL